MTSMLTDVVTDETSCLLTYKFATAPAPLQVSKGEADSPGSINIWASAPEGKTVYCKKIILAFPLGEDKGAFCPGTAEPNVTPNLMQWTVHHESVVSGAQLGLDPLRQYAQYDIECLNGFYDISYTLLFSAYTSEVSRHEGTFSLGVIEHSATELPKKDWPKRKSEFQLRKGPMKLYLNNFVAVSASTAEATVPLGEFGNGDPIRLKWEGNGTGYTLYGNTAEPIYSGDDTSYTIAAGAARATTFTLVGQLSPTGETCTATTSITIADPDTTPASTVAGLLNVAGPTTLTGAATLAGLSAAGNVVVSGQTQAVASVTASSLTTVTGTATLGGDFASLAMTMPGGAADAVTAQQATVNVLTVSDGIQAFAPQDVVAWEPYSAPCDGVLVGAVLSPADSSVTCAAMIWGFCGEVTACASGGNTATWGQRGIWSNANSFALPTPNGTSFWAAEKQAYDTLAPVVFQWFPLGPNASLDTVAAPPAQPSPPHTSPITRVAADEARISRVAAALSQMTGGRATPEQLARLTAALSALVTAGQH
jgi:hypothetical protein